MRSWWPDGLGDEEQLFVGALNDLGADRVDPVAEQIEREARVPASLLDELRDHGLLDLTAPESAGGAGASLATAMLAAQRCGAASAAVGLVVADANAVGVALARDPDLASALVGTAGPYAIVDAVGDAEPEGASPVDGLVGRVEGVDALGGTMRLLVLTAGGIAVVDPGGQVELGQPRSRTGLRGLDLRQATVDVAAVAAEHPPVGGQGAAVAVRHARRLGRAAVMIGVGQAAMAASVTYLEQRRQFGRLLGEYPALRRMVAEREGDLRSALAVVYAVARSSDALTARGGPAIRRATATASAATVAAVTDAVQLHGGYGYTTEYVVERLFRDALSLRAGFGGRRPSLAASAHDLLDV